jgi:VWFA-related protein
MRLRLSANIASTLLLACLLATAVWTQNAAKSEQKPKEQKGQDETLLRLATELVQIDLLVTDSKGNLVRDLKREDFELLEDGIRQQITHFSVGTATRPATWLSAEPKKPNTDSTATPVEVRHGRYIVLAVDDFHLAPENLILAKRALLRFIEQQMVSGDQTAIATTSGTLGLFQQFTSERDVLQRAINRLSLQNRTVTTSFDVPRITDYQAELIDLGDADALELAVQEILRLEPVQDAQPPGGGRQPPGGRGNSSQGTGGISARDRAAFQAQAKARAIVAQNAHYTDATLTTLESIIRSLRPLPGRKIVVLLSDGFFMGGTRNSKHYDLRRITDAATRAGVVIYSIDARGLIATPPGGDASEPAGNGLDILPGARARIEQGALQAKLDGLNALAYDTGGFLVANTNDLSLGFQRVLNDNETYYVLAYEPTTPYRDGRFHKIEVRLVGKPGLTVRTRKGYLAPVEKAAEKPKPLSPEKAEKEAKAAKESQIRTGLGSLFPLRGIPVDLSAHFVNEQREGPVAVVTAHIAVAGLNFKQSGEARRTALEVVGLIFDEKGKVAANFGDRVELNLKPASFERALKNGLSYRKLAPLKPGFYQVRLAVREEGTAALGSAAQWIEIDDLSKKQLTLSSVFLSKMEDSNEALTQASKPAEEPGYQPGQLVVSRRFKRGAGLDFYVIAYNAKVDGKSATDLVIQSQVFSGSKLVYASPLSRINSAETQDLQRLPYAARLSLASFDPGEYELRLLVIDRLAKTTAHRRLNFTVE